MNSGTGQTPVEPQFKLDIQHKKHYMHITVTGTNSPETVMAFLDSVLEACKTRNCRNILVEERLDGPRLSFSQIAQIAAEASERAVGSIGSMAYVDVNAEDDSMEFAELVARNRAIPIRVFSSVPEAEAWIEAESEKAAAENGSGESFR